MKARIRPYLGRLACTLVGLYLLLSPAYALLNFQEYASEVPYFIRYVLVPGLIGAAFLATGLLARPRLAAVAGTYGLSALLALFMFEALLTYRSIPLWLGTLGQLNDEQREMLEHNTVRGFTLRRLNRLSGTTKLSEALLSGFPGTKVVLCAPKGEVITYTADRYGFNNPDQVYAGPVDVMLLGDSFVEGFCLPSGEDLASRLRVAGLGVTSMGIRGNGPLIELATLGRFGRIFRPRHVVMVFFAGNDWENLAHELTEPWLRAALAPNADYGSQSTAQETLLRAKLVMEDEINPDRVTMADVLTRTSMFRNFFALQQTFTLLGLVYPKIAEPIPEFGQTLRRAKALTENWGGTFTVVFVPRVDRFMGVFSSDYAFDQMRRIVLNASSAEGVEVVDLVPALSDRPDPSRMYAPDAHFSADGTTLAAALIVQRLAAIDQAKAKGQVRLAQHHNAALMGSELPLLPGRVLTSPGWQAGKTPTNGRGN
jgi:GDSL-like Lipase/Acylhydrolase family